MIAKYALSAAALLQLANVANGQVFVTNDEGLPDDLSSDEWASVAESSNFTQTTTFSGRDVSSSFPGESQDWTLHLALKDDIDAGDDKQYTAGTISLSGPDGGDVEFDDSWQLCVHVFNVKLSSSGGFGSATNSCEGIVAPECVDDLRKNGISNYGEGCPSYKTTPSCLRDVEEESRGGVVAITADNADQYIGNDTTILHRLYGTHSADQESPDLLLESAGIAQAVVTVFGSSSGDSESETWGEVTCLLPDTAEEGTTDPTEGAAAGFSAFAGWAALTAAVVYQLL